MPYLRFVVPELDRRTGQPAGLMGLAYDLLRSGQLTSVEDEELRAQVTWIEENVLVPVRFARKRNVSHKDTHGLSWFKHTATEAIGRMYEIAQTLRRHDHVVEVMRTERPGYVVYEDQIQIVAEPFHGER